MKKIIAFIFILCHAFFAKADYWNQKADFLGGLRVSPVGFSIGSKGYIGTGLDNSWRKDFWEYDPAMNTWTQVADFGGVGRYGAVGFSIGNKGYVGTGIDSLSPRNDFWEYDPSVNVWLQKATFAGTSRYFAAGFSIGNKGYLGTGNSSTVNEKDFWEYNPASDTWTPKADFGGAARVGATGLSIGNKGYIGLGNDNSYAKKDFWEYNPATDSWTRKADFGGVERVIAIGFSIFMKGYIGMGDSINSFSVRVCYSDFWEFDPNTNSWTQKADFGGGRRSGTACFSINGKGFVGTGINVDTSSSFYRKDFWEYNPDSISGIHESQNFGFQLYIYPNPAYQYIILNYEAFTCNKIALKIFDVNGKEVFAQHLRPINNNLQTKIDISHFSKGIYFIEADVCVDSFGDSRETVVRKFVKN